MAIHSFLKAERGDPDWQFSPEDYIGKEFKIIDASMVEIEENDGDRVVLRQNPTEKDLLAKHLRVNLQKNSTLDLMILNEVDENLQQVFLYDIHLKPGANLSLGMFVKDGKLNKHILQVFLEDGASFAGYGLITNAAGGDSEVITKIIHDGQESASSQLFMGLAGKESQTVFQSTVVAEPNAHASQIGIESSNMIIEEGGRCYAKPDIYLNAEYCKSSQGAEISSIGEEKLGYLESKGIPEDIARDMLISRFRNQVINLIQQDNIRDEVKELYVD